MQNSHDPVPIGRRQARCIWADKKHRRNVSSADAPAGELAAYPEGKTPIDNARLPALLLQSHDAQSASCQTGSLCVGTAAEGADAGNSEAVCRIVCDTTSCCGVPASEPLASGSSTCGLASAEEALGRPLESTSLLPPPRCKSAAVTTWGVDAQLSADWSWLLAALLTESPCRFSASPSPVTTTVKSLPSASCVIFR